jgi:hypothetical protein
MLLAGALPRLFLSGFYRASAALLLSAPIRINTPRLTRIMKTFFSLARFALPLLFTVCLSLHAEEETFTVDEADSLDFDSFHEDKEGEEGTSLFGITGGTSGTIRKGENAFHPELDNPGKNVGVVEEDLGSPKKRKPVNDFDGQKPPKAIGEIRNIRVRYALYNSKNTPLHAHDAVPVLHSYISDYCPTGWLKLAEWSMPIERDYYLYFQFQCLAGK